MVGDYLQTGQASLASLVEQRSSLKASRRLATCSLAVFGGLDGLISQRPPLLRLVCVSGGLAVEVVSTLPSMGSFPCRLGAMSTESSPAPLELPPPPPPQEVFPEIVPTTLTSPDNVFFSVLILP